jgi:hypothetical protein
VRVPTSQVVSHSIEALDDITTTSELSALRRGWGTSSGLASAGPSHDGAEGRLRAEDGGKFQGPVRRGAGVRVQGQPVPPHHPRLQCVGGPPWMLVDGQEQNSVEHQVESGLC